MKNCYLPFFLFLGIAAFGQMPVSAKTATSLAEALREVADPRRAAGRQFPLYALLASAVLALSCGARTVSDLFRFVQELTPAQRRALRFRSAPDNPWRVPPPGEGCWRKVLKALPPAELTRVFVAWQLAQTSLPPLLAIDGKTLHRGLATLVTLCNAETGEPLVQVAQCGPGHEKNLAHALLEALPPGALDGAIVGGDALYADPALVRPLVQDQGAIALVQLKANQPKAAARAEALLTRQAPPFFRRRSNSATAASTNATTARSPSPRRNSASSMPPNCSKSSVTAPAKPPA